MHAIFGDLGVESPNFHYQRSPLSTGLVFWRMSKSQEPSMRRKVDVISLNTVSTVPIITLRVEQLNWTAV